MASLMKLLLGESTLAISAYSLIMQAVPPGRVGGCLQRLECQQRTQDGVWRVLASSLWGHLAPHNAWRSETWQRPRPLELASSAPGHSKPSMRGVHISLQHQFRVDRTQTPSLRHPLQWSSLQERQQKETLRSSSKLSQHLFEKHPEEKPLPCSPVFHSLWPGKVKPEACLGFETTSSLAALSSVSTPN